MSLSNTPRRHRGRAGESFALVLLTGALGIAGAGRGPTASAAELPLAAIDAELAGLPAGSRAVRLTWERAYALALARGRAQAAGLAEVVDPEELLGRIERLERPEFAFGRIRTAFLADVQAGGTFHDPAGGMFAVLHGLQAVENARRNVLALERLLTVVRERIEGESSGLTQLDLDRIDGAVQDARLGLVGTLRHYRDRLDTLKVELGLAPGAPIVADRGSVASFRDRFADFEQWSTSPNRDMSDLPRLVGQLPMLGDVLIEGQPVFAALDAAPNQLEPRLAAAVRTARQNRQPGPGDPAAAAALELRVRNRVRSLDETRLAYRLRLRSLVLAVRLKDHAFERVIAPSPAGAYLTRSPLLKDLVDQEAEIVRLQNNLLALWAAFQGGRLELYRDLGTLPYDDWQSFSESLSARPGADAPAPPPVPAPGAPEPPGRPVARR